MGKAGRPRKPGKRTKSNRPSRVGLKAPHDYGNIKVVERRSRFQHFMDDKGLTYEGTSAGRLWIVGAFDGLEVDAQVLRDCLLEYGRAYWGEYPSKVAITNYLQESRGGHDNSNENTPDPHGERFNRLDRVLRDCGYNTRQAVHHVVVDQHFFPDMDKEWVERIINSRILAKREAFRAAGKPIPESLWVPGETACDSDEAMLELLKEGALALARGTNRVRMRSAA